jgi:hypothetical protein
MKEGGYQGYYTNHSLRVSTATRLFDKCVDEQLIMARTGHSSTDGVRAYKRTSVKLQELTSDVLNGNYEEPSEKKPKLQSKIDENTPLPDHSIQKPVFQISGGSNITINISSGALNSV